MKISSDWNAEQGCTGMIKSVWFFTTLAVDAPARKRICASARTGNASSRSHRNHTARLAIEGPFIALMTRFGMAESLESAPNRPEARPAVRGAVNCFAC